MSAPSPLPLPLIGGVLVLCLASSAGAYMFNQGGDGNMQTGPTGPTGPTAGPTTPTAGPTTPTAGPTTPTGSTTTPSTTTTPATVSSQNLISNYSLFSDLNVDHEDETCIEDATLRRCQAECDLNPKCTGFNWNEDSSKCCYLTGISGKKFAENTDVYIKHVDGHTVEGLGNRTGGKIIKTIEDIDILQCGVKCTQKPGCHGFSYNNGNCELKRPPGISSAYYDDGKQYYNNSSPIEGREVFNVYGITEDNKGYNIGKNQREEVCNKFEAEVATEEQIQAAYDRGAEWCVLGWYKDPDNIGMPIQTASANCGSHGFQKRGATDTSKSAVNCYGFKPDENEDSRIAKFNSNKWSRYST